jgi:methylated-DNA-[protein]-cysteine S-methyltransferase
MGRSRESQGKDFDQRVWEACARVPRGKVVTYRDLAVMVGGRAFKGYRAVGQALNRNPFAPRVPCHRVVGSDGRLTGYAGGLAAKSKLLRAEGVDVTAGKVDLTKHRMEI